MPKNQYISWILFLLVVVTLVNLFYKHHLTKPRDASFGTLRMPLHPVTKTLCPIQGFKCPTDQLCDCEKFCTNAGEYAPFRVVEGDPPVYVANHQLSAGTYCLPRGIGSCNRRTSIHVFSLAGWSCLPINTDLFKGDKKVACKNAEAEDNDLNVLWDDLEDRPADAVENLYRVSGGRPRYRCKCESKSLDGTRMVSTLPFVCSVDYCLREIPDPLPAMGWDGSVCNCGVYPRADPDDPTSPCVLERSRIENDVYVGRVDCMTEKSFTKKALFCPTSENITNFQVYVKEGKNFDDYLLSVLARTGTESTV